MKTIGKYQIFADLQKGPITTLYKAFDAKLERIVFIKQLNVEHTNDKELCDRFIQEGSIIANTSPD